MTTKIKKISFNEVEKKYSLGHQVSCTINNVGFHLKQNAEEFPTLEGVIIDINSDEKCISLLTPWAYLRDISIQEIEDMYLTSEEIINPFQNYIDTFVRSGIGLGSTISIQLSPAGKLTMKVDEDCVVAEVVGIDLISYSTKVLFKEHIFVLDVFDYEQITKSMKSIGGDFIRKVDKSLIHKI